MEQRVNDQPAFLLHRRDYQDSSLILEIFTRDYGRMSLLARGARKRRDVSHFQIAHRLQLGWSGKGELKILNAIESRRIQLSEISHLAVFYLNELLMLMLAKQDPHVDLFDSYQLSLLKMLDHPLEPILRNFELDLLQDLGLMPDLSIQHRNGNPLQSGASYLVDPQSGVIDIDQQAQPGRYSGAELLAIHNRQFDSPEILSRAKRLMRSIIDFNLQGRALQSRQLYQQMTQAKYQYKQV